MASPAGNRLQTRSSLLSWIDKQQLGAVLWPWLVCTIGVLSLKYSILLSGGFHESALGLHASGELHLWEKLSLFRSDLLLCSLLVPLCLCILTSMFSLRWRIILCAFVAFLIETGLTLEVIVYESTGAFAPVRLVWAVVEWALGNGDSSLISIPLAAKFQLALWIVIFALAICFAFVMERLPVRWLRQACLVPFLLGALGAAGAVLPQTPEMAWSPALLKDVTPAFFKEDANSALLTLSPPELMHVYQQDTNSPQRAASEYFGKASNYNVLWFVLEAIPAQVFDPAKDSLRDMPNVQRLRAQSFVSSKHFTTFPLTNYAVFSLFTSLYAKCAVGDVIGERKIQLPGMIRDLKDTGYKTAYYGYVWKIPHQRDDRMLAGLGFDQVVEPTIDPVIDREGKQTFSGPLNYVEDHDRQVLLRLRQDIHRWTGKKQRFAAAFFPEMAHDPWRPIDGNESSSIKERGHALAVYQDAWLGILIDELKNDGALENTIIVVTSDHGLRMLPSPESGPIRLVAQGKLDDIVMRVPLLVYVPKVLRHTVELTWPTSHIDIAPTILDLLGISRGRDFEQGAPIWNPRNANRRLFLSMDIFGAAGLYDGGTYYMQSGSGSIFKNAELKFGDKNAVDLHSPEAESLRRTLAKESTLQHALLAQLLNSANAR